MISGVELSSGVDRPQADLSGTGIGTLGKVDLGTSLVCGSLPTEVARSAGRSSPLSRGP